MPYIIIHSTNERIQTSLRRFGGYRNRKEGHPKGEPENYRKGHQDLIGYKMPNSGTAVLKDTPQTRIYAASLLYKAPAETIVMFSESKEFYDFSIEEQQLGKRMAEGKLSILDVERMLKTNKNKVKDHGEGVHQDKNVIYNNSY